MVCGFQDSSIKVFIFDPSQIDVVTAADISLDAAKLPPKKPVINATAGLISFKETKSEK